MTKEEISEFIISSFDWERERVIGAVELVDQPLVKSRAVDVPRKDIVIMDSVSQLRTGSRPGN